MIFVFLLFYPSFLFRLSYVFMFPFFFYPFHVCFVRIFRCFSCYMVMVVHKDTEEMEWKERERRKSFLLCQGCTMKWPLLVSHLSHSAFPFALSCVLPSLLGMPPVLLQYPSFLCPLFSLFFSSILYSFMRVLQHSPTHQNVPLFIILQLFPTPISWFHHLTPKSKVFISFFLSLLWSVIPYRPPIFPFSFISLLKFATLYF